LCPEELFLFRTSLGISGTEYQSQEKELFHDYISIFDGKDKENF
jgi:hypothetical protein